MNAKAPFLHRAWRGLRTLLAIYGIVYFQGIACAKDRAPEPPPPLLPYARTADLVGAVPAIAVVRVIKLTAVPAEQAPGVAAGKQRVLVRGETISLIRGNDVLARQMSFLMDIPVSGNRKLPKWKGRALLIFGEVQQRVDFFQLVSSSAVFAWSGENEALVRRVVAEFTSADAPPEITGVNAVFHVEGSVQGEGETQIFLDTANDAPISLSIIRKPDEQPQFGVSLGELVDNSAALPPPDSPLWYRLACGLPADIPADALRGQAGPDIMSASKDYAAFLKAMPTCDRQATPIG